MDKCRDLERQLEGLTVPPELEAMLRHESARLDHALEQSKEHRPMGRGFIQIDAAPVGASTERNRRKRQNRKNKR